MCEIDVTKCGYNYKDNCLISPIFNEFGYALYPNCETRTECAYKQLQRYKQVVKDIKEIAENNICSNCDTTSKCKQLNKQNCDWKQIIQKCEEVDGTI